MHTLLRLPIILFSLFYATLASITFGHEVSRERFLSVESTFLFQRDGQLQVEQRFKLQVEGDRINRGPCLPLMTVYKGTGGLVLNNVLAISEARRNGKVEPFRVEKMDGLSLIFLGSADYELPAGVHEYEIHYSIDGNWAYGEQATYASVNLLELFQNFPVESANASIVFPDSVEIKKASLSFSGAQTGSPSHQIEQMRNGLQIQTSKRVDPGEQLFLNLVWKGDGYLQQSDWLKIVQQHPKLPLSVFSAFALVCALILMARKDSLAKRVSAQVAG